VLHKVSAARKLARVPGRYRGRVREIGSGGEARFGAMGAAKVCPAGGSSAPQITRTFRTLPSGRPGIWRPRTRNMGE
jgi:hypothetical protein